MSDQNENDVGLGGLSPLGGAWVDFWIGEGAMLTSLHILVIDASLPALCRAWTLLRLITGSRLWARNALLIHVTTGHDMASTDRLLKAAGARTIGDGYDRSN